MTERLDTKLQVCSSILKAAGRQLAKFLLQVPMLALLYYGILTLTGDAGVTILLSIPVVMAYGLANLI